MNFFSVAKLEPLLCWSCLGAMAADPRTEYQFYCQTIGKGIICVILSKTVIHEIPNAV